MSDASLGTNRGVALLGDKIFMVTDNAHLIALNRTTGKLVWEVVMPDEAQRYGSTVAPLIVKDMVVAGVSGGDWGIRGFLAAYKVIHRRAGLALLDRTAERRTGIGNLAGEGSGVRWRIDLAHRHLRSRDQYSVLAHRDPLPEYR